MSAYTIGLTGPMGAGKSAVAQLLRGLGARVLDADAIVHQEQSRGTVGYSAIVQQFGTGILGPDREIDRAKLAAEVFADPLKLARLERIVHPRVVARVLQARSMLPDGAVMVVEAVKLLESAMRGTFDEIWVVLAPREAMIRRLSERGVPEAEARARLGHQRSDDDFRAAADVVIDNGGTHDETLAQVRAAWDGAAARASARRTPGSGT